MARPAHWPAPAAVRAPAGRWLRVRRPVLAAASAAALTLALRVRDPHADGSWGLCPVKLLTGLDCPGCGCLRAVNDLARGDVLAAASSNLLLVLALPFVVAGWGLWAHRLWTGAPHRGLLATGPLARVPAPAWWLAAGLVAGVFTVLRNTPWGSWLHS